MDQALIALRFAHLPDTGVLCSKEVAYALNMQPDTIRIYRYRHPDRLPFHKVGGRYFYKTEDVIRFIQSLPEHKRSALLKERYEPPRNHDPQRTQPA